MSKALVYFYHHSSSVGEYIFLVLFLRCLPHQQPLAFSSTYLVCFRIDVPIRFNTQKKTKQTKNQVHQISLCNWFRSIREKVQSPGILQPVDIDISRGCEWKNKKTDQHRLGIYWILWITCAGMATHSCLSAWSNSHTFAGAFTLPWIHLSSLFQVCLFGFESGDVEGQERILTLLSARNCVVWCCATGGLVALWCWRAVL